MAGLYIFYYFHTIFYRLPVRLSVFDSCFSFYFELLNEFSLLEDSHTLFGELDKWLQYNFLLYVNSPLPYAYTFIKLHTNAHT